MRIFRTSLPVRAGNSRRLDTTRQHWAPASPSTAIAAALVDAIRRKAVAARNLQPTAPPSIKKEDRQ